MVADRCSPPVSYTHLDVYKRQDKEIKKFFLLYEGPYEVVDIKMDNVYVLRNQRTGEIVGTHNATNLKSIGQNEIIINKMIH